MQESELAEAAGGVPAWDMDGHTVGQACGRGAPCSSAVSRVLRPADVHERAERQREQSGPVSERGMRAGMEAGRVRDAPRSCAARGLLFWDRSRKYARCRVGWGVGRRTVAQ